MAISSYFINSYSKVDHSTSQSSSLLRDLTSQIAALSKSLYLDLKELEDVQTEISNLVEEARGIGSTIQSRISSLRKDANQLETVLQSEKLLQPYLSGIPPRMSVVEPVAPPAPPAAVAGVGQAVPAPVPPDPGLVAQANLELAEANPEVSQLSQLTVPFLDL